jgi:ATP-dependent Clp protease ATP-binding subunit ClpA
VKSAKAGPRETLSPDEFWSNEDYRENYKAILLSRVREHFGPALYNRIDEKIGFNGLREVDYVQIAANAVQQLTTHLKTKTGVQLWATPDVAQAIAGALRSQIDASARDINRFVRKYILDDAFALLKLKELEDKSPLAPAYQIKTVMTGRKENRILDHFELVPAEPPQVQL